MTVTAGYFCLLLDYGFIVYMVSPLLICGSTCTKKIPKNVNTFLLCFVFLCQQGSVLLVEAFLPFPLFPVFFFSFLFANFFTRSLFEERTASPSQTWRNLFWCFWISLYPLKDTSFVGRITAGNMSTAKPTGIKAPTKIARPPGTGAPKTNPPTGVVWISKIIPFWLLVKVLLEMCSVYYIAEFCELAK